MKIHKTYEPESLEECDELRRRGICGSCIYLKEPIKDREYFKKYGCTHRIFMIEDNIWQEKNKREGLEEKMINGKRN